MKKQFLTVFMVFMLTFFGSDAVYSQTGISLRLIGQDFFEIAPKGIVTTTFEIINLTDKRTEFIPVIELPQGWKSVTGHMPFVLEPRESRIEMLSFLVSKTALAGRHFVTYRLRSKDSSLSSEIKTITINVLSVSNLKVRVSEVPAFTIAGEKYTAVFIVSNESNREHTVRLIVESSDHLPYEISAAELKLEAGETKSVRISVQTDPKLREKSSHCLRLTAQGIIDKNFAAQASVHVEIIPRIAGEGDQYRRIPSKLTIKPMVIREQGNTTITGQTEFSGEGAIDDEETTSIRYSFRTPDTQDQSRFGTPDEYAIRVASRNYEVKVGDHAYSLSPLTENYLNARGVGGKLNVDAFGMSGYYAQMVNHPQQKESGLNIGYLFNDKNSVFLNFLQKSLSRDVDGSNWLASLYGVFQIWKHTTVEMEWAFGKDGDGENGTGRWLNIKGDQSRISYDLQYSYAGPSFPGYYQDEEQMSAAFTLPVVSDLSLSANFRQRKSNLDQRDDKDSAPLERYLYLGVNKTFHFGTFMRISTQYRMLKDLLPFPDFDSEEKTAELSVGHSFEKVSLYGSVEGGVKHNHLIANDMEIRRYTASLSWRPTPNQAYSAYFRHSNEEFYNDREQSVVIGFRGDFRLSDRTSFDADFQNYYAQNGYVNDYYTIETNVRHTLRNHHEIAAKVLHTHHKGSHQDDETLFMMEYSVPMDIPAGRKKGIGTLKGVLFDDDTGKPISNTVLMLNDVAAVTDTSGEFIFPAVKPGVHELRVDSSSLAPNKVIAHHLPIPIMVEEQKDSLIKIAAVTPASISGQIVQYALKEKDNQFIEDSPKGAETDGAEYVRISGIENLIVEIQSDSEVRHLVTDKDGGFRADGLRPGNWKIEIQSDRLPEYSFLEEDQFEVVLDAGENKSLLVRVLPKKRKIRMVEGGSLVEKQLQTISVAVQKPAIHKETKDSSDVVSFETISVRSSKIPVKPLEAHLPYAVVVSSCLKKESAEEVLRELQQGGFKARMYQTVHNGQVWHKVEMGRYATLKEASEAAREFQNRKKTPVVIEGKGIKIYNPIIY